jgi:predicted dehydrogenase
MAAVSKKISRRQVLGAGAACLLSAQSLPMILPRRVFGANDRIGVAMIGVRNQGAGNLKRFLRAGADVVGISDVDTGVAAEATKLVTGPVPTIKKDYRELLDRSDVDAVVVTTPDHWHALMTIHACQAGKDVYCEKPLSLTVAEGRRMVEAARKYGRVVQTGSQQRSSDEFWRACMLVRNGWIGEINQVQVGISGVNHPGPLGPDSVAPVELDYDRWLGPAPWRPYNEKRVHYNFRFWWDYSGGQMTNWGAHHLDIAHWGLGMDDSGPVSVEGSASFHPEMVHEVTETLRITYTYANGVTVICGQGQKDIESGTRFIGTEGEVYVNRGKLRTSPKELAALSPDNYGKKNIPVLLKKSRDHTIDFLDCVRSRDLPICDVEIGHRSATVCHLGNIVARLGRSVRWDPSGEKVIGDTQAQSMIDRAYRPPYDA